MATVKSLIEQLQEIEDQNQPIIFQYYIAEHFIDPETNDNLEPKRFEIVAENVERIDGLWEDIYEEVATNVMALESDNE